eukprot:5379485-Amphidinium_carterae.1
MQSIYPALNSIIDHVTAVSAPLHTQTTTKLPSARFVNAATAGSQGPMYIKLLVASKPKHLLVSHYLIYHHLPPPPPHHHHLISAFVLHPLLLGFVIGEHRKVSEKIFAESCVPPACSLH